MATGTVHEVASIEDVVRLYAGLPPARGELMLKEVCDAVRMIAPVADVVSFAKPLRWIDSDGGMGTVNLTAPGGGDPIVSISAKLPGAK